METPNLTSQKYMRNLAIIHGALLLGQAIFASISLYITFKNLLSTDAALEQTFIFIVPSFVLVGFFAGRYIMNLRLVSIRKKTSLKLRLLDYQSTLIIKWALLEAPCLLALIVYLLTGNFMYLGFAGLVMLIFGMNVPSRNKVSIDLELNKADNDMLYNPKEVLV